MPNISGDSLNPFGTDQDAPLSGPPLDKYFNRPSRPRLAERQVRPSLFEPGRRVFIVHHPVNEHHACNPIQRLLSAGKVKMNRAQAAACHLFRNNLNAMDPTGRLRPRGEFTQAYSLRDNFIHVMGPMHYRRGMTLNAPTGISGATVFIHSAPSLPLDGAAYSRTNPKEPGLMYFHGEDKFYVLLPEFHELENPFDMGPPRPGVRGIQALPDQEK